MTFVQQLKSINAYDKILKLIESTNTIHFPVLNEQLQVINFFQDIVNNLENASVSVHPDADLDGMLSAKNMVDLLNDIGVKDISLEKIKTKSHKVGQSYINKIKAGSFTHIIIVDSSSQDEELLETLSKLNIKVLIIDHHILLNKDVLGMYDNILIVSNKRDNCTYSSLSAGMLTAIVAKHVLTHFKLTVNRNYIIYGYIAMYSDICDTSSNFMIEVINYVETICLEKLPKLVQLFLDRYSKLGKWFVTMEMSPKISALMRNNKFDLVYTLIFDIENKTTEELIDIKEQILTIKKASENLVNNLVKSHAEEYGEIAILTLDEAIDAHKYNRNIVENHKGLIAMKKCSEIGKPVISVLSKNRTRYIGSGRDSKNRNLLDYVSSIIDANGHKSAFGFECVKSDLELLKLYLPNIKLKDEEKYIVVDGEQYDSYSLTTTLNLMAKYNEISGGELPIAVMKVPTAKCKPKIMEKVTFLNYKNNTITVFDNEVLNSTNLITKPVQRMKLACYIENYS